MHARHLPTRPCKQAPRASTTIAGPFASSPHGGCRCPCTVASHSTAPAFLSSSSCSLSYACLSQSVNPPYRFFISGHVSHAPASVFATSIHVATPAASLREYTHRASPSHSIGPHPLRSRSIARPPALCCSSRRAFVSLPHPRVICTGATLLRADPRAGRPHRPRGCATAPTPTPMGCVRQRQAASR